MIRILKDNIEKVQSAFMSINFGTGIDVSENDASGQAVVSFEDAWEDLKAPSTAINPPGAASDPDRSTTTGLLEFSASATNIVTLAMQMPHAWKLGTDISPHIHIWYPDGNSGNSVWKLEYQVAGINAAFPGSYTADTKTFAAPEVADQHVLHPFDDIDMSGIDGVSSMMLFKLSRLGGEAADTYGSAMPLLEFDIHYIRDANGSDEEVSK